MSAVHVCLYHTVSRELVGEPQLDQKKISASGFCIVGLKVDLKDHFPWIWVRDFKVNTPTGGKKKSYDRWLFLRPYVYNNNQSTNIYIYI